MLNTRHASAGALLTIDLDAIRANYRLLREKLGGTACAAVVKADAYGLGADRVAPALAADGCTNFFVAHLDEAIALRPHVPSEADVFVLHGSPAGVEADFVAHRVIPVAQQPGPDRCLDLAGTLAWPQASGGASGRYRHVAAWTVEA